MLLLEGPSVSVSLSSSLIVGAQTAVRRLCVEYKVRLAAAPPMHAFDPSKHAATPKPSHPCSSVLAHEGLMVRCGCLVDPRPDGGCGPSDAKGGQERDQVPPRHRQEEAEETEQGHRCRGGAMH